MPNDDDRTEVLAAPHDPARTDAPDGAPGDDGTGVEAPPADTQRPRRGDRLPWVVAAIAVLIAVAAIVVAVVLVNDARQPQADLEDVEQAAGAFALALTTWDASDGMADTRESLREAGTETFASDVDQLFGGTDDLATLEELGARSEGEVNDVLVQSVEGDEAVALAVVVQRVTTEVTEGEEVSLRYARLGLARVDGAWRVDEVELVVDALQETAERSDPTELPGFGDGEDAGTGPTEPTEDATDEDAP